MTTENGRFIEACSDGASNHIIIARARLMVGAIMNGVKFDLVGFIDSLENNFSASAMGCKIAIIETLLGPLRNWLYPKYFRSSNV